MTKTNTKTKHTRPYLERSTCAKKRKITCMSKSKKSKRFATKLCEESDSDDDDDGNEDPEIVITGPHLFLWCEITNKTVHDVIMKMTEYFIEPKEIDPWICEESNVHKTLYMHINSPGGDLEQALCLVDTMAMFKKRGNRIITIVEGYTASAASVISVAGSERWMQPNATLRLHQFSTFLVGRKREIDEEKGNLDRLQMRFRKHYVKYSNMSKKNVKDLLKTEKDMEVQECMEKGLVDKIMT